MGGIAERKKKKRSRRPNNRLQTKDSESTSGLEAGTNRSERIVGWSWRTIGGDRLSFVGLADFTIGTDEGQAPQLA